MTTATKERPILFSAAMVRAILDGRKHQTRRVIKPQPDESCWFPGDARMAWSNGVQVELVNGRRLVVKRCPYGVVGDRLWVRESFLPCMVSGTVCKPSEASYVCYRDGAQKFQTEVTYPWRGDSPPTWEGYRFSPSIHMPRWASRITLTIESIRVERLQDISEEDAEAEGVDFLSMGDVTARDMFQALWDRINGKTYPWDSNPWTWVISFKKV
jgi:hypothetical protein